jgi:hypothetical protein
MDLAKITKTNILKGKRGAKADFPFLNIFDGILNEFAE